jgi:hypothetical protein
MKASTARDELPKGLDLAPYAGRWVAIVRGQIAGVGSSAKEARLASKYQRPKEEPLVIFVSEEQSRCHSERSEGSIPVEKDSLCSE